MCSICKEVLVGYGIPHTEARCPLRASQYCSYCASFGHLTTECRTKPSKRFTEPAFVEQLIGVNDLVEFGIRTATPLPHMAEEKDDKSHLLEIKDTEQAISAFLVSKGIKPGKKGLLRFQLEQYAKGELLRVVYQK
jgi:hypothetical protein